MLLSLGLNDWKSFRLQPDLRFSPVTLLVGPNGSGKSNVIDALRFLQGIAMDLPVGEVLRGRYEGQREIWPGIRGFAHESARAGTDAFHLATRWALREPQAHLEHTLSVSVAAEPLVRSESLKEIGATEFDFVTVRHKTHGPFASQRPPSASVAGTPWTLHHSPNRSLLGQLLPATETDAVRRRALALQAALRGLVFLDVQPNRMRDYRPDSGWQLGVNAENISPILYQLGQQQPDRLADVIDWLSELCGPAVAAIDFDRTRLGETMLFLVERGGAKISARSASDGTLRFLGLVAALMTVPPGSTLVLEEPDVGLHPSRLHLLASLFEDTSRARDLQIIATTHSPTLLAHISPSALADVLAFGRDPEIGCSVAKRAADLPHFATLRDAKDLDHLVSNGWLERAL